MMNEREHAKAIVERCWKDSMFHADTGEFCPKLVRAFQNCVEVELMNALTQINRLREIAECNDPGAVNWEDASDEK